MRMCGERRSHCHLSLWWILEILQCRAIHVTTSLRFHLHFIFIFQLGDRTCWADVNYRLISRNRSGGSTRLLHFHKFLQNRHHFILNPSFGQLFASTIDTTIRAHNLLELEYTEIAITLFFMAIPSKKCFRLVKETGYVSLRKKGKKGARYYDVEKRWPISQNCIGWASRIFGGRLEWHNSN